MLSIVRGIVSSPIDACAARREPARRPPHDLLADPRALRLRAHRERPHPSLAPRAVHDVERRDLAALVAPHHRAAGRILDRVAPDRGIEERHAHAHDARRGDTAP